MSAAPHPCGWSDSQIEALGCATQVPPMEQIMHVRALDGRLFVVFRSGTRFLRAALPSHAPGIPVAA